MVEQFGAGVNMEPAMEILGGGRGCCGQRLPGLTSEQLVSVVAVVVVVGVEEKKKKKKQTGV